MNRRAFPGATASTAMVRADEGFVRLDSPLDYQAAQRSSRTYGEVAAYVERVAPKI